MQGQLEHTKFLERVITVLLCVLVLSASFIVSQLRVSPSEVKSEVQSVKGLISDELRVLSERVAKAEAELIKIEARSAFRWTSFDMRTWVDAANKDRPEGERLPAPVPADRKIK